MIKTKRVPMSFDMKHLNSPTRALLSTNPASLFKLTFKIFVRGPLAVPSAPLLIPGNKMKIMTA